MGRTLENENAPDPARPRGISKKQQFGTYMVSQKADVNTEYSAYLSERGIGADFAAHNGIAYSPPSETEQAIGHPLPAVRFQYSSLYNRYRFLGDRALWPLDEKGKPIKCLQPPKSGNQPYFPLPLGCDRRWLDAVKKDASLQVLIVEGEADTLGVCQVEADALTIGISGCWNWGKSGKLHTDLAVIKWDGRAVTLCPDSDWQSNPSVFNGWHKLASLLHSRGAIVAVRHIPTDGGLKVGAGDFIHRQGVTAWKQLPSVVLSEWVQPEPPEPEGKSKTPKEKEANVFDLAYAIASEGELWHTPEKQGYIDIVIGGVRHTHAIRSKNFRLWLSAELFKRHTRSLNSEARTSLLDTLEGKALFEGVERKTWLRTAEHNGKTYLDLANDKWEAVEISRDGWRILDSRDVPVRFNRGAGQLPLPTPTKESTLNDLWAIVSVSPKNRILILVWLLSALLPTGSKPIVVLAAPRGGGKTSTTKALKQLIDPGKGALLPAVGDRRALAVAANSRWVLTFDNLTSLSTEQQDALCCASTGAGFSHRTLHTDLGETFVEYLRPQILTGVDLLPTRSDLLDRCLLIGLEPIHPEERLTDEELAGRQIELTPSVLGALLTALSTALKNLEAMPRQPLPRMADFARIGIAAETALGYPAGAFMTAYRENIDSAVEHAIESNPIATAIRSALGDSPRWEIGSDGLVARLKQISDEPRVQKLTARSLGRMLAGSLKADLNSINIVVEFVRDKHSRRWVISRSPSQTDNMGKITSLTSPTSPASQGKGLGDDVIETHNVTSNPYNVTSPPLDDVIDQPPPDNVTITSSPKPSHSKGGDVNDVSDVISGSLSVCQPETENVDTENGREFDSIDCNQASDSQTIVLEGLASSTEGEEWIDA